MPTNLTPFEFHLSPRLRVSVAIQFFSTLLDQALRPLCIGLSWLIFLPSGSPASAAFCFPCPQLPAIDDSRPRRDLIYRSASGPQSAAGFPHRTGGGSRRRAAQCLRADRRASCH